MILFCKIKIKFQLKTQNFHGVCNLYLTSTVKGKYWKLIVIYEALSGLDENNEIMAINLMKQYFQNSIMLYVSHRDTVRNISDYVIQIDNGNVKFV